MFAIIPTPHELTQRGNNKLKKLQQEYIHEKAYSWVQFMKENKRKNSWHGFFWWISLKSDLDAISELCDPAHAKVLLHFDGLSALVNHLVHIKWGPSCTDSTCTG